MNVLLLARYGRAGSTSRLRFYQFLPHLAARQIDVHVSALLSDDYVRRLYGRRPRDVGATAASYVGRVAALVRSTRYDALWVEKELFPWMPALAEWLLARAGVPYVVDYDDATFHRYDQHGSRVVRWALGGKIDAVMRNASAIVAGSPYLARRASAVAAGRVCQIPTVVDLDRYEQTPARPSDAATIGWIGSPATESYLDAVRAPLAALTASGVRVHTVGATGRALPGVARTSDDWSEATEVASIRKMDVGIMPVPDEPFERGKCGFKLIQYMACGLPVVASPVGVNAEIVEHGVNGFLAATPTEWEGALRTLCDDPALRRRMGAAGRAKVERQYSVAAVLPRVVDVLRAAAQPSAAASRPS